MSIPESVRAYLAELGKAGRAANTPAQQCAARANGRKGGRPVGSKDSKPRVRRTRKTA